MAKREQFYSSELIHFCLFAGVLKMIQNSAILSFEGKGACVLLYRVALALRESN